MVTLSRDAQGHLDRYLRQVKAALRGHPSVDVGEIERDVLGHIDAELSGKPEPVGEGSLREVLARLGTPDAWVPADELPEWRRVWLRMRSGPEEWRLAYLTLAMFLGGVTLFLAGPVFWPLPVVCLVAALLLGRASLGLLAAHDEAVGPRKWLIYPVLLAFYVPLAGALLAWPLPLVTRGLTDVPALEYRVAGIPGPFGVVVPALVAVALGAWWAVLGLFSRRFTKVIRDMFYPMAEGFTRAHATWIAAGGFLLIIVGGGALLMAMSDARVSAAARTPKPAVPVDPIPAILDAFPSHPIVALGEGTHGNEQGHAFRLSLIRDPRFAKVVNDIVVESGNARYQDVMDRFIAGGDVPPESLRRVWQNTTQPDSMWDIPIYEEFFRAVRTLNVSLPAERRLRVLLGDPPIDWDAVRRPEEYGQWDRDAYPAEVIRREVIERGRRALVIYGDLHFIRKVPQPRPGQEPDARSIVGLLERAGVKVFSIRTIAYGMDLETLQADVLSWPRPSVTVLRGTALGAADFSSYYPRPLLVRTDGTPVETPSARRPLPMEEQFDALLYLGPQSTITRSQLTAATCGDARYMEMRMGRLTLMGMQPGIDRLKKQCAGAALK
jgi:hypothetical protein